MPEDDVAQIARFILQALVDDPESVRIDAHVGETMTLLVAHVARGQAGQVIGKHGRNIDAIRTLLLACGAKENRKVHLEFDDGN